MESKPDDEVILPYRLAETEGISYLDAYELLLDNGYEETLVIECPYCKGIIESDDGKDFDLFDWPDSFVCRHCGKEITRVGAWEYSIIGMKKKNDV